MKTLKHFISLVATAAFAIFASVSCTSDSTSPVEDTSFQFDISYSTGEAIWDPTNPEELVLNKLGVGTTGTIPYLIVKSNTYWTIENDCEWLEVSPLAGPTPEVVATDEKVTNVYLTVTENKEYERSTSIKFVFADGNGQKPLSVPIRQMGAKDSKEQSLLTFLTDDFGEVKGDNVRVKFYPFSKVDESGDTVHTYDGIATAGDPTGRPFSYASSENCYASDDVPSSGYEDTYYQKAASGGANIMLDGEGYFDVCVFNNQGKCDFRMSFGAVNNDGKFRTKDLKVWISCDGVNWTVDASDTSDGSIPYTHAEPAQVNGWSLNTTDFSIVPGVSDILYFRFENLSSDVYRIDDIRITELDGESDNIYSLIQTGSDIIGIPVTFEFQNLTATETKGSYWLANDIILSEESGVYDEATEEYTPPTVPETVASAAHVQFITGTDESRVKIRTDLTGRNGCGITISSMSPRVYGMIQEDYWIFTLPVHKMAASSNIRTVFTFKNTAAGPKYMYYEWAQCTNDEYKFHLQNILALDELEKREFYATLDWQVAPTETIGVPNDEDVSATSDGIPMGSASSPKGYYKSIMSGGSDANVTYSLTFKCTGSDVDVDHVCNFKEAMDDGYIFFRLRCAHDITAGACNSTDYQRINNSTHQGTSYLTKSAKFTFDGTGATPEFSNTYKVLATVNVGDESGYDGESPQYLTDAVTEAAGIFFADVSNGGLACSGNNVFNGSTENDETGAAVLFYSPYSSLNDGAELTDILLSVPTTQTFTPGVLIANSVPTTLESDLTFKTTNTMRAKVAVRSALLKVSGYATKAMSSSLSRIEVSTVDPRIPAEGQQTTPIAGSYHYDLTTNTLGEPGQLQTTITSNASAAIKIPTSHKEAADIYVGLWEGTHKLYVKFFVGTLYYLGEIDTTEYVNGHMNSVEFVIDELPSYVATDKLTGIANAEQFKQFVIDVASGKSGSQLDAYRNIDGELGFGGAALEADKVIDMSGVNMATWPQITLTENFNGGGYVIKNLNSNAMNCALFGNIQHGCTVSNITFDSSCKLSVCDYDDDQTDWSLLCIGGYISESAANHIATGSLYNIVSYASVDITCDPAGYNSNMGVFMSKASGGQEETDTQSSIINCINYGDIYIHNYTQSKTGTGAWNGYKQWGGIIGKSAGMLIQKCENHGNFVVENINSPLGIFYIGGIAGYNCNRTDNNTATTMFGVIDQCVNYGEIKCGQTSDVKVYGFAASGIVARNQWSHNTNDTNKGKITIKLTQLDPWPTYYNKTWATQIAGTTNSIGFISIGGCMTFAQNNIATGANFTGLKNEADIYVEADSDTGSEMYYADNAGICVGGCIGRTGANAYNPLISGCTNTASVTLKSNSAVVEAFVGGVCGIFVSNQHTSTAYNPTMRGSSNSGTVKFVTDNPSTVIAHVGGVAGAMIYGTLQTCVNVGTVSNDSYATREDGIAKGLTDLHLESSCGSILGCQHRSTITAVPAESNIGKKPLVINGCAIGGTVNGVKVTENNYENYLYQYAESCWNPKDPTESYIEVSECYYANFGN